MYLILCSAPAPTLALALQPFKQVMRLAGGTGLGLYSLSNRVKELNGKRGVSPRNDGKTGSVFWFSIPYRPDPQFVSDQREAEVQVQDHGRSGSIVSDISPSPVSKNFRFLVVDDTLSILKVVGRALLNKKYNVETAENGFIALNMLIDGYAASHYDVVLMDFQMPVMDGIEAVSRYREYEKNQSALSLESSPGSDESTTLSAENQRRSLLIIGMSANSDNAIVKDALEVGMDAFLPKPFTMSELQAVLDAKHPSCIEARSPLRMSASQLA